MFRHMHRQLKRLAPARVLGGALRQAAKRHRARRGGAAGTCTAGAPSVTARAVSSCKHSIKGRAAVKLLALVLVKCF